MGENGTAESAGGSIRNRLLEAGLELLAEQGYRGATTREIAQRAGVTEQTLFRHFGTKDALLREAVQHFTAPLKALVPHASGNLQGDLLALIRQVASILEARQGLIARMMPEISRIPELVTTTEKCGIPRLVQDVARLMEHYQANGQLRRIASEEMALAFIGPLVMRTLLSGVWQMTVPFDAEEHVKGFLEGYLVGNR